MPTRALIERRPWLLASIAIALAFVSTRESTAAGLYLAFLRGAPFALLALYALLRHRGSDTRLLALMILFQAVGVAIADLYPDVTALVMALGFVVGTGLFLLHRRERPVASQRGAVAALLLLTPVICQSLAAPHGGAGWAPAAYGLALGGMAASAWGSSFPRYRVGVGAVMIVAASLLALWKPGFAMAPVLADRMDWALLYLGNLVMATGITGELRGRCAGGVASR